LLRHIERARFDTPFAGQTFFGDELIGCLGLHGEPLAGVINTAESRLSTLTRWGVKSLD
jgi:hypothetical protein